MKQIIVMRKDLGMRKGKMIAQGAHASLKATLENLEHPSVEKWLSSAFTKIAVGINSEAELLEIYEKAQEMNIIVSLIEDAGRTEFKGIPTITCIAVGPATNEELKTLTGHLKLL